MRRWSAEIWRSKGAIGGALAFCFGLFGVYAYFIEKQSVVPTYYLFWSWAGAVVVIVAVGSIAARVLNELEERLPNLLRAARSNDGEKEPSVTLLLSPSRLIGMGIGCSVYFVREGFELLIAQGYVSNVQQDGKIQVILTEIRSDLQDEMQRICRNDPEALKAVIVKPGIQAQGM